MIKLLSNYNSSVDMNNISYNEPNIDINFCVFDYSNLKDVDYRFLPLVFIDEYTKAGVELQIGQHIVHVPWDWAIVTGEMEFSELELIEIKKFHGRDFEAFVFNPLSSSMPQFLPIKIINFYPDLKWTSPAIFHDNLIGVPLTTGDQPLCVFFSESKTKLPDSIDVSCMI